MHQSEKCELPGMSVSGGTFRDSAGGNGRVPDWLARNLVTQGYCLAAEERSRLNLGLRFAPGLCFPLVALALVSESPALLAALAAIGVVAGFTSRHPFDLLWNYGVRHGFGAPPLPPNPMRRRHAFKVGAALLLVVAALFAAALLNAALALGAALLAACGIVTATYFCLPSFLLSALDRFRAPSSARGVRRNSIAAREEHGEEQGCGATTPPSRPSPRPAARPGGRWASGWYGNDRLFGSSVEAGLIRKEQQWRTTTRC